MRHNLVSIASVLAATAIGLLTASIIQEPADAAAAPSIPFATTPPPPVGQHPRIFLTPADLPALRVRIKAYGNAVTGYDACLSAASSFTDPKSKAGAALALVNAGHAADLTLPQWSAFFDNLDLAAMVPLITQNATDATNLVDAVTAYVRTAPIAQGSNLGFPYNPLTGVATAYDLLYNWMSPDQRDLTRNWIAEGDAKAETFLDGVVYGFAPPADARNFNWVPNFVGQFGISALAIEGEKGYEPQWYDKSLQSMRDFLQYGIGPDGCPVESIHYFAYGMQGGVLFIDAAQRRGASLLNSAHLVKVPYYWSYDLFPWTEDFNDLQDTTDQTMGVGDIYLLMNAAHPDDPLMNWIYATHYAFDGCAPINKIATLLWATPPNTTIKPADLGLSDSRYFPHSGIAYMRTDWSKEADYLEIQSDPIGAGPSHMHADRDAFTFAGNGILWAMSTGFHAALDVHQNEVLIDGKGEGFFPMPGKPMRFVESEWACGFMGDAKEAYDFRADWDSVQGGKMIKSAMPDAMHAVYNAFPYNPVQRAFRSAVLVRGAHPYAMVVNDIRKDDKPHDYDWHMLTPLGNAMLHVTSGSAVLGSAYEGPYLVATAPQSIKVSFDLATAGKYRVSLLYGKPYNFKWNWWPLFSIDDGNMTSVSGKSSANGHIHWQSAPDVFDLTAGHHTLVIRPRLGMVQIVAAMISPAVTEAQTAPASYLGVNYVGFDVSSDPVTLTAPAGGAFISLLDAPLPNGWSLVRDDHPAHLLLESLGPVGVKITSSVFELLRPDSKEDKGTVLQVNATANTTEPNFRFLLYSFRVGDPMPIVKSTSDNATIKWPDGTIDKWWFGKAAGIGAQNGAAVKLTRTKAGKTQTFKLLGSGK